MKIAVASAGLDVATTFSECSNFNFYTTCSYEVAASQNLPVEGLSADQRADLLAYAGAETVLVGNITPAVAGAFEQRGIEVAPAMQRNARAAAETYLAERAARLDDDAA